jgi:hypothetical protein
MKRKSPILVALLLASGPALAQYQLDTITVRPAADSYEGVMTFNCNDLRKPSPSDVGSLLKVSDKSLTPRLSQELLSAVGEACSAGIPSIVVQRASASSSKLSWFAVPTYYESAPVYYEADPVYYDPDPVYVDPDPDY